MIREMDHYRVVLDALESNFEAEEQAFVSAAELSNKLEMLRKLGGGFANIEMSQSSMDLMSCRVN